MYLLLKPLSDVRDRSGGLIWSSPSVWSLTYSIYILKVILFITSFPQRTSWAPGPLHSTLNDAMSFIYVSCPFDKNLKCYDRKVNTCLLRSASAKPTTVAKVICYLNVIPRYIRWDILAPPVIWGHSWFIHYRGIEYEWRGGCTST